MNLNASSMSELPATSLAQERKILQSFLFLQSKTNVISTLNLFNSFNYSFNFFIITGLVLISSNSG